jgi:nucleotide-binding universal stress UspA family protein
MDSERIIVGYDGSAAADRALGTAVDLARGLERPLTVLVGAADRTGGEPVFTADTPEEGERLAESGARAARDLGMAEVEVVVSLEAPDDALVLEAGRGASLVVVGHRGHGGIGEWVLGSTAKSVVDRAPCSVLVVR